jgi:luciferase family oxidoreductase group 1
MLGTSDYGAQLAALLGIPYCFAYFITDGQGTQQAIDVYRQNYRPSERFPEPQVTICLWALAADTEAEADRLFAPRLYWKLTRDGGDMEPLFSPETVALFEYSAGQKAHLERIRNNAIFGSTDQTAEKISMLADRFDLDEIVVLTWTYDEADRRHSYELLASAFGLV